MSLRGRNALCVGATAGIGRAVAIHLAEHQANVTVIGRNPNAGPEILGELTKANPTGSHSYITVDASNMKSIKSGCDNFLAANKDKPLHYLVMSQGIASMNGRTETNEGIDVKLAVHYYGRMFFIRQLLDKLKTTALQNGGDNDVRVMSILSGGVHGAYTDTSDLDLKRNFSLQNAANAAGFYNDLALDQFARDDAYLTTGASSGAAGEKRGISFIHAAPGVVNTTWGKDFPWYLTIPLNIAKALLAKSPEDCAKIMMEHGLQSEARRGQGFYVMGEKGQAGKVTKEHNDVLREKVWEHTNQIIDQALAMN